MLTIKQITDDKEAVIAGLKKKHFKNAEKAIDEVIKLNDERRNSQSQLDEL
ncbi:MAG: serine--tRNA ligase, partial [Bacteroides sp.]|nr:serine--tRNA ligase [Bacteroides sp.]